MYDWNSKANDIFVRATEIEEPAERRSFIERECGGDEKLIAQVESLLAAGCKVGSFLERPAAPVLAAIAPTLDSASVLESVGTVIGSYKLLQKIGEGGMGIVYMAEQQKPVRRKVALKIIKPGMDSQQVIARFEAERQALAMMDHQNIAKVFDAGTTETGRPYFVMELVHGIPLTAFCDDNRLTLRQRLELFIPVCQAIQHAHQKGIIHRDVKPSNVLVTMYDDRPVPKVIDFGIAKATDQQLTERTMFTQFGAMVGTFEYMSPEQAEMNAFGVDTRSDIYSLGVLLYELLTGTTPLEKARLRAAAFNELVRIIKEEEPPRPSVRLSKSGQSKSGTAASIAAARKTEPQQLSKLVRGDLDWIVMRCLEKQRDRRYETANGLARDIQRYLADEPVEARPPSAGYRMQKFIRRNKGRVVTAALVLLVLVGGIVGTTWGLLSARAEKQRADAEAKKAVAERETAKRNAAEAQAEKERAHENAADAQNEKERAEKELLHSEWLLYANQIASAQRAWDTNDVAGAWQHLDACRRDLRGWEYNYLCSLFTQNQRTLDADPADTRYLSPGLLGWLYSSPVQDVAFSPDGKRIACVRAGKLAVWDVAEGRVSRTIEGTNSFNFTKVAFSPDGKRILSIGLDGSTAKIWDAADGREIRTLRLKEYRGYECYFAYSPDGTRIASSSQKTFKVWDATSGKDLLTLTGHTSFVSDVAFSPDGKRIASGAGDGTIRLWDATTGRELLKIGGFLEKEVLRVKLVFSPDGKRVAGCGTSDRGTGSLNTHTTLKMWDAASGHEMLTFKDCPEGFYRLAFSPDGKQIATAGNDGLVRIWDAANGQELFDFKGHKGPVSCVAFSPDGKLLASGGMDGALKLWDPTCRQETLTLKGGCFPAAFSPDGRRIVSGIAGEGRLRVWNSASGNEELLLTGGTKQSTSVAYGPDGRRIAGGFADGSVRLWDAATGKEELPLKGPGGEVTGIRFNKDGMLIASDSLEYTSPQKLWGPARGQRTMTLKASVYATGMVYMAPLVALSPDGKRIVGGQFGAGVLTVWDTSTGREIVTLGRGEVFDNMSVAFSPDSKRIVVGCQRIVFQHHDALTVWDATSGTQSLALKGHNSEVRGVAFSPDGKRIASGGADGVLKIWDATGGQETLTIKAHAEGVSGVAFSPDGKLLISDCGDGTIKVWDASRGPETAR